MENLREWLDPNQPRLAVSADGVPLVLHIPNAINERGRVWLLID